MKQSPMPPRKKPMPRSSLRSTPPAQGSGKPASPRRSSGKYVGKTKAQDLAKERSDDTCEVRIPGVGCLYHGSDFHHRHLHGQGGKWCVCNGLRVCRMCHSILTNTNGRRAEFEYYGWIIPVNQDPENRKTPAEIEVFMWHDERLDWWLLLPDGTAELAPWPEGKAGHPDDLGVPRPDSEIGGAA